jgi:hypothetical protein
MEGWEGACRIGMNQNNDDWEELGGGDCFVHGNIWVLQQPRRLWRTIRLDVYQSHAA